eukprot:jgi/Chlat1/5253/Chrsp33S00387
MVSAVSGTAQCGMLQLASRNALLRGFWRASSCCQGGKARLGGAGLGSCTVPLHGAAAAVVSGRADTSQHAALKQSRLYSTGQPAVGSLAVEGTSRRASTKVDDGARVKSARSRDSLRRKAHAPDWDAIESWVVFSDLHLSTKTQETCLAVLQHVHEVARQRNAGILFLGDFWHLRGSLPVEPLNAVLELMQTWTQPMLMIPGNHDQVNLGGSLHALMPLEAAGNGYIRVFSEPAVFLDALWLPYRRDQEAIKAAMQMHGNGVKAVFAHVDVMGAYMNEACQARSGLEASIFPVSIPVFTGHYHKPHTVSHSDITYVGSPYQVSHGEAGQEKRFLVLNKEWQVMDAIPISFGPRHFAVSLDAGGAEQQLVDVQAGDRVRLTTTDNSASKSSLVDGLKLKGVNLELVHIPNAVPPRIESVQDLGIYRLFDKYAENVSMSDGARLLGRTLLEELSLPAGLVQPENVHVEFSRIELEGYGPFLHKTEYPLARRGLCVISGRNVDSFGADSNGAGKTTLAMAPLWALTGSTDPRPGALTGLNGSDLVHHTAKRATVRLEGVLNGKDFTVQRSVGARHSSLQFWVGGEDLTCQEMKLTQEKLDQAMDTSAIARMAFHGQYAINGLLDSTDRAFKDEIGRVVNLDAWSRAKEKSSEHLKATVKELNMLEGAVALLEASLKEHAEQITVCKRRSVEWVEQQQKKMALLSDVAAKTAAQLAQGLVQATRIFQCIQQVNELGDRMQEEAVSVLDVSVEERELESDRQLLTAELAKYTSAEASARTVAAASNAQLAKFESGTQLPTCGLCLQPIGPEHHTDTLHKLHAAAAVAAEDLRAVTGRRMACHDELRALTNQIKMLAEARRQAQQKLQEAAAAHRAQERRIRDHLTDAQQQGHAAQLMVSDLPESIKAAMPVVELSEASAAMEGSNLSVAEKRQGLLARLAELTAAIRSWSANARSSVASYRVLEQAAHQEANPFAAKAAALREQHASQEDQLIRMKAQYSTLKQQAEELKEVDVAYGHTGIQSYVVEGALAELQSRAGQYLELLSGGTLSLELQATTQSRTTKNVAERINKVVYVRTASGELVQRSLKQLSGGERRRLELAVALCYADFLRDRNGIHCSVIVLDEVLQHLDDEGCRRVASVLRSLEQQTVLVVSQARSMIASTFDVVDYVVKAGDIATIQRDL